MLPDDLVGVANTRHMRAACGRQPLKLHFSHATENKKTKNTQTETNRNQQQKNSATFLTSLDC